MCTLWYIMLIYIIRKKTSQESSVRVLAFLLSFDLGRIACLSGNRRKMYSCSEVFQKHVDLGF